MCVRVCAHIFCSVGCMSIYARTRVLCFSFSVLGFFGYVYVCVHTYLSHVLFTGFRFGVFVSICVYMHVFSFFFLLFGICIHTRLILHFNIISFFCVHVCLLFYYGYEYPGVWTAKGLLTHAPATHPLIRKHLNYYQQRFYFLLFFQDEMIEPKVEDQQSPTNNTPSPVVSGFEGEEQVLTP